MSDRNKLTEECCILDGPQSVVPQAIDNRPGLSAIAYRVGTHAGFREAMKARLSRQAALGKLTTRKEDDFTVALLDAWAATADVLTFYQERYANESYLRTATERLSLQQLARLIGYELNPGVAAGACLAFRVDEPPALPPGSELGESIAQAYRQAMPQQIRIGSGTKVQSVPGQDELPQVFETVEPIDARAEWNELRPELCRDEIPGMGAKHVYLKGTATGLNPGDALLLIGQERETDPGSERWDFRRVDAVDPDPKADRTKVSWLEGLGWKRHYWTVRPAEKEFQVYALRQRVALFGHNAPDWRALPKDLKREFLGLEEGDPDRDSWGKNWPGFDLASLGTRKGLLAEYFTDVNFTALKFARTDAQINFGAAAMKIPGSDILSARWSGWLKLESKGSYTFQIECDAGSRAHLWVKSMLVIDVLPGQGNTKKSGTISLDAECICDIRLETCCSSGISSIKLYWSQNTEPVPARFFYLPEVQMDALYPAITPGNWLVLSIPEYQEAYQVVAAAEDSRTDFLLTAKTTRLTLMGENLHCFDKKLRETVVFARQECLARDPTPVSDDIFGNRVTLDRGIPELPPGRALIVSGKTPGSQETMSEIAILDKCEPAAGGATTLLFTATLKRRYRRETVRIYANAARATHGETVTEVLGSGDGSRPFQRFTLSQPPLTRVSASTPSGSESTLEVRVNDVRWREVPSHFGSGPDDRTYTTRQDQDGKTVVHFGDGKTGARLPTGRENVRAAYRKGLGLEGNVGAGKLSVLMTRLLGVRDVTNPIRAAGAEDPESLRQARRNAPLTVLTMDRVVSLRDYEDFARAFAGIAKARADWFWTGVHRVVCITVAGPRGEAVASETYGNLLIGIGKAADPCASFRVLDFRPVTFMLKASLKTDPDYRADAVLGSVKSALAAHFSFDAREFGQAVSLAEAVKVIQSVPGVVAVDVDELKDSRGRSGLHEPLSAGGPTVGQGSEPAGAELLTLDEKKVVLKEMT